MNDPANPSNSNSAAKEVNQTKAARRLSTETLFAFALPDVVKKDLEKLSSTPTEPKKEVNEFRLFLGILGLFGIGSLGAFYFLFSDSQPSLQSYTQAPDEELADVPRSEARELETQSSTPELVASVVPVAPQQNVVKSAPIAVSPFPEGEAELLALIPTLKPERLLLLAEEKVNHPSFRVRVSIVRAATTIRSPGIEARVQETLVRYLADPDELVRGFAARGLAMVGNSSAIPELDLALRRETSPIVRQAIESTKQQLERPQ